MNLSRLTAFAYDHPKTVIGAAIAVTILFGLAFPRVKIDTDPENMLQADQPDRVFYDRVKRDFGIRDLIVVGIVDPAGIFRPEALARVARATDRIQRIPGVVIEDLASLTTTDNVKSAGGLLEIRPVMDALPVTADEVESLRREIAQNPFLDEKLASRDGTAVAIYVPLSRKDQSYRIGREIEAILREELLPGQTWHLAGLPVAEDTFGHEMFLQMGIVAPLAFGVILLIVFLLFRRPGFLLPVAVDAMFAVVWTMGLLIATGQTVHIMSSMIPVFLMPIAILDDMHILSGFFDRYREVGQKRRALLEAMRPIYKAMLFTSITSAVGFASLALAPIPPVRVFGLFVAFGILAAFLLSQTMVPAMIALMGERRLHRTLAQGASDRSLLDRALRPIGRFAFRWAAFVLVAGLALVAAGAAGISRIRINDNPVRWFKRGHPMRVADEVMNRLFGGTYMAYLVAEGGQAEAVKRPEVVAYLERAQAHLEADPLVGKTSSVADIVKRINLVLHDNDAAYHRVPDTAEAVGQFLFLFQSSGDPNDLDNFVDREARRANVWVQMKGGDNEQMKAVQRRLEEFAAANPPPAGISLRWSGLTYINKVWQGLMVWGMLKAVLSSFVVVFLLMVFGFRSILAGLLSMIPLSIAMLFSYGLLGWVGKDYDMPIAVCSALALGLAIDFAIHFFERFRARYAQDRDLAAAAEHMFGEPGRAIARNAIVVALGFLPLVASTLTPYVTVGLFFALLMGASALSTFLLLPAAIRWLGPRLVPKGNP